MAECKEKLAEGYIVDRKNATLVDTDVTIAETEEKEIKKYVLDTNVLIDDPDAINAFEENMVLITDTTLEELDGLKKSSGDTGYNARKAIRNIAELRNYGDYLEGVPLPNNGIFKIMQFGGTNGMHTDITKGDNRIIATILRAKSVNMQDYILVTNDIAMQAKASMLGLKVQEYQRVKVKSSNYKGKREINLPDEEYQIILDCRNNKRTISCEEICVLCNMENDFVVNEYVSLCCGNLKLATKVSKEGLLEKLDFDKMNPCNITPKNISQKYALDALLASADEIPMVILEGPAGCAKTFLSLAAGLDGTFDDIYNKVIISRNNVLADNDIGFLKGSLEDKMNPLLAPFYDNLEVILRGKYGKEEDMEQIKMQIEDMKDSGILEVASLAYMRGRSLKDSFVIIDEVQNATPNQILTIVTRIGSGSKIVLCGDPDQIDAPYLSKDYNGLIFAKEKMKGSSLCAQITFDTSESVRSPLAYEAASRMV